MPLSFDPDWWGDSAFGVTSLTVLGGGPGPEGMPKQVAWVLVCDGRTLTGFPAGFSIVSTVTNIGPVGYQQGTLYSLVRDAPYSGDLTFTISGSGTILAIVGGFPDQPFAALLPFDLTEVPSEPTRDYAGSYDPPDTDSSPPGFGLIRAWVPVGQGVVAGALAFVQVPFDANGITSNADVQPFSGFGLSEDDTLTGDLACALNAFALESTDDPYELWISGASSGSERWLQVIGANDAGPCCLHYVASLVELSYPTHNAVAGIAVPYEPNPSVVYTSAFASDILEWDAEIGTFIRRVPTTLTPEFFGGFTGLTMLPDGRLIAIFEGSVYSIDVTTGAHTLLIDGSVESSPSNAIVYNPATNSVWTLENITASRTPREYSIADFSLLSTGPGLGSTVLDYMTVASDGALWGFLHESTQGRNLWRYDPVSDSLTTFIGNTAPVGYGYRGPVPIPYTRDGKVIVHSYQEVHSGSVFAEYEAGWLVSPDFTHEPYPCLDALLDADGAVIDAAPFTGVSARSSNGQRIYANRYFGDWYLRLDCLSGVVWVHGGSGL